MSAPPPREDPLSTLRELGYLAGPGERYVARRLRPGRGAAAVALWVGGLGGALASLLPLASTVATEPALLDHPRELLRLAVALAATLGLVAAGALGLATWAWLRLGRRAGSPGRWLAWAVGILAGLYVADVLGRALGVAEPLVAGGLALAAGLVAALAAGVLRALLAVARWRQGEGWRPTRVGARHRVLPGLVGGALALALLLGLGRYHPLPPVDELAPAPLPGAGVPPLLLALEGLGPGELDVARELGLLPPWLEGLGWITLPAQEPATLWTTVATAQEPSVHGLVSLVRPALPGSRRPLPPVADDPVAGPVLKRLWPWLGLARLELGAGGTRTRASAWEILSHHGQAVRVLNWWASGPPPQREGLELASERWFLARQAGATAADEHAWPPRLREVAPAPGTLRALRSQEPALAAGDSLVADRGEGSRLASRWRTGSDSDLFHLELARRGEAATTLLYLNGFDILGRAAPASGGEWPQRRLHDQLAAAHLRFLLGRVEALVGSWPGPVLVALAKDRGESGTAFAVATPGQDPPDPVPRVVGAHFLREAGVAPAADMPGGGPPGPRSWGAPPRWRPPPLPAGPGELEQLRSLGYIGGR